jgi:hypothetical protein
VGQDGSRFQVVDNRYRGEPDDFQELADQLLADRTVFLPGATNESVANLYNRFNSRYGRKLRRRARVIDSVDGFVVWLDPASPESDTADVG